MGNIFVLERTSHMHDNCTITRKGGGKQKREELILAALHGILGPAGAAAPGEHSRAVLRQRQSSSLTG